MDKKKSMEKNQSNLNCAFLDDLLTSLAAVDCFSASAEEILGRRALVVRVLARISGRGSNVTLEVSWLLSLLEYMDTFLLPLSTSSSKL